MTHLHFRESGPTLRLSRDPGKQRGLVRDVKAEDIRKGDDPAKS